MNTLHVLKIESDKGFMKLESCDISMQKGLVHICGKNRQGKSAILKMIQALKGKKYLTDKALHEDNTKGDFTLSLGTDKIEFLVKYSFTKKGSYLSVEAADGTKYTNGQEVLSGMLCPLMDPWGFVAMVRGTPAERRQAFELAGELMTYDFDIDAYVREIGYDEDKHIKSLISQHQGDPVGFLKALEETVCDFRKSWTKTLSEGEGSLADLKRKLSPEDRNTKAVDIVELLEVRDTEQENQNKRMRLQERAEDGLQQIAILEEKIETYRAAVAGFQKEATATTAMDMDEFKAISRKINDAAAINKIAAKAESLKETEASVAEKKATVEDLESLVTGIRDKKTQVMEEAAGIEGLGLVDGEIYLNGQPMASNSSEEECLSFAIDLAMEKSAKEETEDWRLKTLICQNASLLDDDAIAVIDKKAEEYGFQCLMEEVSSKKRPGVIFVENGTASNIDE